MMDDLRIGESQDLESPTGQILRAPAILLDDILPIVYFAVDFDHQPGRHATKVDDERADSVLTTNGSTKLVATQGCPEDRLGVRLALSKITSRHDPAPQRPWIDLFHRSSIWGLQLLIKPVEFLCVLTESMNRELPIRVMV